MVRSADLVDALRDDTAVVALLVRDRNGNPAVYQVLAPEEELYPRACVFETSREHDMWSDDIVVSETSSYRVDIWSREQNVQEISQAVRACLESNGFRVRIGMESFIQTRQLFYQTVTAEIVDENV